MSHLFGDKKEKMAPTIPPKPEGTVETEGEDPRAKNKSHF